jgi:type IV secretion system protein TrbE
MPGVRILSLADELPYHEVYPDGIVELSGHSIMATIEFRGPDLETVPNEGLSSVSDRVAAYISVFGKQEGWSIFANTINLPARPYLNPPSWMDGDDRWFPNMTDTIFGYIDRLRADKMSTGLYEERSFLSIMMSQPKNWQKKIDWAFKRGLPDDDWLDRVEQFKGAVSTLASALNGVFAPNGFARIIDGQETKTLIRFCALGEWLPDLDESCGLPDELFSIGRHVRIDGDPHTHVRVIGITGLPAFHTPAMLNALRYIDAPFRLSQRFVVYPAEGVQAHYKRGAITAEDQSKTPFNRILAMMPGTAAYASSDPVGMRKAIAAVDEAGDTADIKAGGALSTCVVVMSKRETEVEALADQIRKCLQNECRFDATIETFASQAAYIGSMPGEVIRYKRRDILSDIYLSRRLPVCAPWTGPSRSGAPWKGPVLLQAVTESLVPFRFDPFNQGWGHIAFLGPTGSGKSSDMRFLLHSWLARVDNARGVDIDVDSNLSASIVSTLAAGGKFLSMNADSVPMQPFRYCDNMDLRDGMLGIFHNIREAAGVPLTYETGPAMTEALNLLAHEKPEHRTLSTLRSLTGPAELQNALTDYCRGGTYGHIMDGNECPFTTDAPVIGVELGRFALGKSKGGMPIVEAIMVAVETIVDGTRPTMVLIDETKICKRAMGDRLVDWLARMRRRLGLVVLSLHFLDEKGKADDFGKAIVLQCATKIFVPFEEAATETAMGYMSEFGITKAMAMRLSRAAKGQALFCNTGHARLVDFALGAEELAICAVNGAENNANAISLHNRDPENFWRNYLAQKGLYEDLSQHRTAIHLAAE